MNDENFQEDLDWNIIMETDHSFLRNLERHPLTPRNHSGGFFYQPSLKVELTPVALLQKKKGFHKPACSPIVKKEGSNEPISFISFQKETIHCTSRFSIFLYIQKKWREEFTFKDRVKSSIYRNLKTFLQQEGKYVPQEGCPKPCSTWIKSNKKKPSSNGIIQIKQVKDSVDEVCSSHEYEKIEVVCKLMCSTPNHYSSQLFIGIQGLGEASTDLIISPPFEFLARKDPHKNKRKPDTAPAPPVPPKAQSNVVASHTPSFMPVSGSPPKRLKYDTALPHTSMSMPSAPGLSPSLPSSSMNYLAPFNPHSFASTLNCYSAYVSLTYLSNLKSHQLRELIEEFLAYTRKSILGFITYHAEIVDGEASVWIFFDSPKDCVSSVELSFMYTGNNIVCSNKFKEDLKMSGKLVLIRIQTP